MKQHTTENVYNAPGGAAGIIAQRGYWLLSALLLLQAPTLAQFTAEEAVNRALAAHPGMHAATLAVEEADGASRQAGMLPNPEVELDVENWAVGDRSENGMEVIVGISQQMPISGARRAAQRAGQSALAAAGQDVEARRREIAAATKTLFYKTLAAQERSRIMEQDVVYVASLETLTRARLDAGDAAEVDWIRAASEHAQRRAEQETALGEQRALRAQLMRLCGIPEGEAVNCVGAMAPTAEELPDWESVQARLAESPRNQARERRQEQARHELEAIRREVIPEPALRIALRRDTAERQNGLDVGISIDLPLFDRKQGAIMAARAKAQRVRAEQEAAQQAELRAAEALLAETQAALTQAEQLRGLVLPKREEIATILLEALKIGDKTLFEVLAEQQAFLAVQLSLLDAERRARLAWLELQALL